MCLVLLNMHMFSWGLVLITSLSLRYVITCALFHFPVSCRLNMSYKTCCTVVGYFLPMMRIQTLVLFLTTNPIWSGVVVFLVRLISLFPISWMCLVLLNMHMFSWGLVLITSLSLRYVITCALFHFPVSCRLNMSYKTCCTVVGYFLPMMRIQTLVLFLYGNELFHGLSFVYWEIYDMLLCSRYFFTTPMGVPLGGKFTPTSNISYLMKGWSER